MMYLLAFIDVFAFCKREKNVNEGIHYLPSSIFNFFTKKTCSKSIFCWIKEINLDLLDLCMVEGILCDNWLIEVWLKVWKSVRGFGQWRHVGDNLKGKTCLRGTYPTQFFLQSAVTILVFKFILRVLSIQNFLAAFLLKKSLLHDYFLQKNRLINEEPAYLAKFPPKIAFKAKFPPKNSKPPSTVCIFRWFFSLSLRNERLKNSLKKKSQFCFTANIFLYFRM